MAMGATVLGEADDAVELSELALEQLRRLSPRESHRLLETCADLVRVCRSAAAAAGEGAAPPWSSFLEEASRWLLYSFHPRLGRVRVHGLVPRALGSAPQPAGAEAPSLSGVRVLVVEDDPRLREGMRELLEGFRAEVQAVGDAQAALARLRDDAPDVLVSDIGLPGLDGYELIRRVRAQASGPRFAAVALTGCTSTADRVRALAAGFDLHLGKPVEPAELMVAIASLLERRASSGT